MKLEIAVSLLTAALAQATLIEHGLPDGVYEADASNTSMLNFLPRQTNLSLVNLAPRSREIVEETPIPSGAVFCHSVDENLSLTDYQTAVSLLFESPLFLMHPKAVRYALYGNSVAYICNESGLNTGSLLEYMQAMDDIDVKCGNLKAGKRVITDWSKYYGRAMRGAHICGLEGKMKGAGGLPNDLDDKVKASCKSHVNGFLSIFTGWTDQDECNDANARQGRRRTLLAMFPWYKQKPDEDDKVQLPYGDLEGYRREGGGERKVRLPKGPKNWRA